MANAETTVSAKAGRASARSRHSRLLPRLRPLIRLDWLVALASLVADKFWLGDTDQHTLTEDGTRKMLTGVHGKLLSRRPDRMTGARLLG
mgnify:CR=1 FL=1